ncbi:CdaR family transcriptional regulator [Psychrobacillus lasiicapitis]|uniref:Sugar diacid utilization regulator SdaR n=1 Tax=Psychrobacillus lasiicapitis TaxID=1636719 RepID=A0A544T2Q5_9BACI|nr:sugar diacid recognition domain-containing protein [Psychrobacillus lasiicapitis]TQR11742.1 sugar diacid utilization regulator SdaR [Psychrobacillus lasiicapitis]GGA19118.1 transcriptional regulator [Psychrobacillus lasiicapitis]
MITKQLANQIVEQTMLRLHRNINVIQTNGMILASGDSLRVDSIHEGAVVVAETREPLLITEENNHLFPKTKPGINMPIFFQEELVGVIGITGNPKEIEEIATLVQLTTEMMVYQALIASEREWERKMQEIVFKELMSGQPLQKVIFERINKIGFQNKPPFHTIMMELDPESKSYQTILQGIEHYFHHDSILVGHYQLKEHFILTSGLNEKAFQQKINQLAHTLKKYNAVPISVGQVVHSLDQVHHSYQTARIALEYGQREQSIIYFEEVELYSLLKRRDSQKSKNFTNRIVGALDEKLLLTLHTYFKCNQQLAICAEDLEIHRHTLTYRLKKIHDLTGYNPALFQDAIVLQIALWMLDGYKFS